MTRLTPIELSGLIADASPKLLFHDHDSAEVAVGLGIDPMKSNISNVGRPIRIVDPAAQSIKEIVG